MGTSVNECTNERPNFYIEIVHFSGNVGLALWTVILGKSAISRISTFDEGHDQVANNNTKYQWFDDDLH